MAMNDCKWLHDEWCRCPVFLKEKFPGQCNFLTSGAARNFCKEYQPKI